MLLESPFDRCAEISARNTQIFQRAVVKAAELPHGALHVKQALYFLAKFHCYISHLKAVWFYRLCLPENYAFACIVGMLKSAGFAKIESIEASP